jgi:uncharacterized protein YecE (DUF72 family)
VLTMDAVTTIPTLADSEHQPLIGCAGWSLPRAAWPQFASAGTHLQRYASRFAAVEINSSFYRPHRPATYARWAASVPDNFRFAVKMPRRITHELRLRRTAEALSGFLAEVGALQHRLGCLLVQLPPSLAFDPAVAQAFFAALRHDFAGWVACEPRHPSWFSAEADALLTTYQVARVAADPAPVPAAAAPGGWDGLVYYRWHGSPTMYYSAYGAADLDRLAQSLAAAARNGAPVWCIFDNTAEGAAITNALALLDRCQPAANVMRPRERSAG